jgi:23S rRNA pseudouridine1911/1915/1917 synthase
MDATSQVIAKALPRSMRAMKAGYPTGVSTAPTPEARVLSINARHAGRRLDAYLALRFSDWSRAAFTRWIKEGLVRSDQRALKPSSILQEGEVLRITIPGIAPTGAPPPLPEVLYEDEDLLVVDKPAGLLMHSAGQKWAYGLVGIARDARPDATMDLAHRLDRETSGVVVLTKTSEGNRWMKDAFQFRRVEKTYQALVRGVPPWEEERCEAPLGPARGSTVELRRGHDPQGDSASTGFRLLERIGSGLGGYALVSCHPLTGRTHQIRAHLEVLGYPILGDKLYGQPDDVFLEQLRVGPTARVREAIGFPRHCLHARALILPLPRTGETLRVEAPLPADMRSVLAGQRPRWEAGEDTLVGGESEGEDA